PSAAMPLCAAACSPVNTSRGVIAELAELFRLHRCHTHLSALLSRAADAPRALLPVVPDHTALHELRATLSALAREPRLDHPITRALHLLSLQPRQPIAR